MFWDGIDTSRQTAQHAFFSARQQVQSSALNVPSFNDISHLSLIEKSLTHHGRHDHSLRRPGWSCPGGTTGWYTPHWQPQLWAFLTTSLLETVLTIISVSGIVNAEAAAAASSSASAEALASPPVLVNPIASAIDDVPVVGSVVDEATGIVNAGPSITLPAILDTLPTGGYIEIVVPTTVPLSNTALIESLGALPANAEVTDIVSSVLDGSVSVQTTLPADYVPDDLPTGVIGGIPEITAAPDVQNIVNELKGGLLVEIAGSIASALDKLASAAGAELPAAPSILPSQILDALESLPTLVAASAGADAGVTFASREKDTSNDPEDVKEKRQLEGLGNLLAGLTGGSNPLTALTGSGNVNSVTGLIGGNGVPLGPTNPISALLGALGGAGSPLGNLVNTIVGLLGGVAGGLSSLTGILGGGSNPLSILTGLLSNLGGVAGVTGGLTGGSGLGAITSSLPLGSLLGGLGGLTGGLGGLGVSRVSGGASAGGVGSIVLGVVSQVVFRSKALLTS